MDTNKTKKTGGYRKIKTTRKRLLEKGTNKNVHFETETLTQTG
jgi:hypothetical protein